MNLLEQTQKHTSPHGSCWQTAIACVLGVPAEQLPDQHVIEVTAANEGSANYAGFGSYSNALNAYLFKHHGLGYIQEPAWKLGPLAFRDPGLHVLIGPTVRTAVGGDGPRILHCVVARNGEPIWDPHPSRTGLLRVISTGWLADVTHIDDADAERGYGWHWANPAAQKADVVRWQNRGETAPGINALCCCPACFVDGEYQ